MTEASGRVLPELTELTEFFWKSGEDGKLRFQRCSDCGRAAPPAERGVPVLPLARVDGGRGVGPGRGRRLHPQRADVDPELPAAVPDRHRRHRRGRPHPSHHQPRERRRRRRVRGHEGAGAVRARRGRLDPAVRAHRRERQGTVPCRRPQDPRRPPDAEGGRQVRGQGRDHRHRHLAHRPAPHARSRWCSRSRPPSRRSPTPASPSTTSTASPPIPAASLGGGMSEGGIYAMEDALRRPPVVDQRRARDARARAARSSRRCSRSPAGCASTSCASAPCGRRRSRAKQRAAMSGAPGSSSAIVPMGGNRIGGDMAVARAVRRVVGRQLDRACRRRRTSTATARRARRWPRSRSTAAQERRAQPVGDLQGTAHDRRLPERAHDHHAVRPLRLRRARATARSR